MTVTVTVTTAAKATAVKTTAAKSTAPRAERASTTREAILTAAERLYAEHGVFAVSNRQVSEAAGQGNNAAVGYHFGTKTDLVRAIEQRHRAPIEQLRETMVGAASGSTDLRDWVACLVRPLTDHLAELGNPTWYARFAAQAMTDPAYHGIVVKDALRLVLSGRGRRRHQPVPAGTAARDPLRTQHHGAKPVDAQLRRPRACPGQGCHRGKVLMAGSRLGSHRRDRRDVGRAGDAGRSGVVNVTVDQDRCVSSGMCVMNAPEVFDQRDDDGVVELLAARPGPDHAEETRKAAAACPALAIHIEE